MSRELHERDEIRKELLPFFDVLVDTMMVVRDGRDSVQAEAEIARAGVRLCAQAARHVENDGKLHYWMGKPTAIKCRIRRDCRATSMGQNAFFACTPELFVGMAGGQ